MAKLNAVTPERHAQKQWKPSTGYAFAAEDNVIPLVGVESSKAVSSMPTGSLAIWRARSLRQSIQGSWHINIRLPYRLIPLRAVQVRAPPTLTLILPLMRQKSLPHNLSAELEDVLSIDRFMVKVFFMILVAIHLVHDFLHFGLHLVFH